MVNDTDDDICSTVDDIEKYKAKFRKLSTALDKLILDEVEPISAARLNALFDRWIQVKKTFEKMCFWLSEFDLKQYQGEIDALEGRLAKMRKIHFSFKHKIDLIQKPLKESCIEAKPDGNSNKEQIRHGTIEGVTNEEIVLDNQSRHLNDHGAQNYVLNRLENCVVWILDEIFSLKLMNLKNCKVYAIPINGSVLVEKCEKITLHLAARQLRIHETKYGDFYICTHTFPVIENSRHLRGAPYNLKGERVKKLLQKYRLNTENESWKHVRDFGYSEPSWTVIPQDQIKAVEKEM
ncbi:uncharacterized protein LOC126326239 [Schistocerca gregaria]|uniref:uncharacterized protein LOC126326239 n=1 Tax=Schistocerca gregaria TaxID=7010 RepID=UPI00211E0008|nr:uncharacterized protein LOC126326239 [Schistocerca gregaria]